MTGILRLFSKRGPRSTLIALIALLAIAAAGAGILNHGLTRYIESDKFRTALDKETAHGLHFPSGRYGPIRRTGFFSAVSGGFRAENGRKAMSSLDARGLAAKFNPWGIFLRRWQFDQVHVQGGEVEIQTYTPSPEPTAAKRWFSVLLPNRVYLRRVWSDPVDVTWHFRARKCGIFGTRLLITPHGRDFTYRAKGGTLKMAPLPDFELRHVRMLITKTLLTLYHLRLGPEHQEDGFFAVQGTAGTGADRSVDFKLRFDRVPLGDWLPSSWKDHFTGLVSGSLRWTGKNPKLESSVAHGSLSVRDGRLSGLPLLEELASITKRPSLKHLELSDCSVEVSWHYPRTDIRNISIEDNGKFRIEGAIQIDHHSLGGAIRLGVAREYLEWLPDPEEVFASQEGGYLWTTVHLSGTIEQPHQDLSPRVAEQFQESPIAFLGMILHELSEWFKNIFE
jgi:hypothetical protein